MGKPNIKAKSKVDKNSDGELSQSEIDNCNEISLYGYGYKNIENLKGLEYFTELEQLECVEQKLSNLDVSKNTKLTSLYCSDNNLSSLDISKNTKLTYLDCGSNNLSSLDISKNTELTSLVCISNNLSSLDISKNTKLTYLDCLINNLSSLDISKNTKLSYLDCSANDLSSLDVSKNTELTEIYSSGNRIADLDLSNNTKIKECYLESKISVPISSKSIKFDIKSIAPNIDADRINGVEDAELFGSCFYNYDLDTPIHYRYFTNQKDIYLSVELNLIEDSSIAPPVPGDDEIVIDESTFPDEGFRRYVLLYIDKDANGGLSQKEIDACKSIGFQFDVDAGAKDNVKGIEYFTSLEDFSLNSWSFNTLDLSKNVHLKTLDFSNSHVDTLVLGDNPELEWIAMEDSYCGRKIDLSGCTNLNSIFFYRGGSESLDLSNNKELEYLRIYWNHDLKSLDLSNNTNLKVLSCTFTGLKSLDLSNNTNLTSIRVGDNSDKILIPKGAKKIDIKSIDPNIDVNKITGLQGAELSGSYFINFDVNTPISYDYITGLKDRNGEDIKMSVRLNLEVDPNLDPIPDDETRSPETEQIDQGGKRSAEVGGNSVKAADTGDANIYGWATLAAVAGGAVATTFVINRKKTKN